MSEHGSISKKYEKTTEELERL